MSNIVKANAIEALIHVLQTGISEEQENAAVALHSLSVFEEKKIRIGNSRAIGPLVELLGNGTPRGKKYAANALFQLSTCTGNRIKMVRSGALKHLIDLMDPATGMVDSVVVVLTNLASDPEGREAIAKAGGIPLLVKAVELGSPRGKENAAAALMHFCEASDRFGVVKHLINLMDPATGMVDRALVVLENLASDRQGRLAISKEGGIPLLVEAVKLGSPRGKENAAATLLHISLDFGIYCRRVLEEGAIPPLVILSKSGTPRAKEKADRLLHHLRTLEAVLLRHAHCDV